MLFSAAGDIGGILEVFIIFFGIIIQPFNKICHDVELSSKLFRVQVEPSHLHKKYQLGKLSYFKTVFLSSFCLNRLSKKQRQLNQIIEEQ